MTDLNSNLFMAHRYLIHLLDVPIETLGKHDERIIERCRGILDNKARELSKYKLSKNALCSDATKVMPRMSTCARCPAISAAPDGCGFMCAITCRAVDDSDFNSDKSEHLDTPKNYPPERTQPNVPNLARVENSPHYGGYGNV